jgi:hypothetical protein
MPPACEYATAPDDSSRPTARRRQAGASERAGYLAGPGRGATARAH